MHRSSGWTAVLVSVSFAAACASVAPGSGPVSDARIVPGQTVTGELTAGDPVLADGSHYDLYRFRAEAGRGYVVTMRSSTFDTYLAVGTGTTGNCTAPCVEDDDGAGGTDSRVRWTAPATGIYEIRANSLEGGTTGAYTLRLEEAGIAPPVTATDIQIGQTVEGRLAEGDPVLEDGSFYDLYRLRGTPGARVTVTLRSNAYDTFLAVGSLSGSEFQGEDSDDDSGGGTDSQLSATIPATGILYIQANSLEAAQTGAYTLQVSR